MKFQSTKYMSSILGEDGFVKISELKRINLFDKKNYSPRPEMGSKAKELLDNLNALERKGFEEGPVTFLYRLH